VANPLPIIAIAGVVALMLSGKKSRDGEVEPEPEPKPGGTPDPKPSEQSEWERRREVLDNLMWSSFPAGYSLPDDMTHGDIWVSIDCEGAAMGRDWKPEIGVGAGVYGPAEFWSEFAQGVRPNYGAQEELTKSAVMAFTERALRTRQEFGNLECVDAIPNPEEFDNYSDYANAWTALRNSRPGLAALWDHVYYNHVIGPMMDRWGDADPEAWNEYHVDRTARLARSMLPQEGEAAQIERAYEIATRSELPNCDVPWVVCGWAVDEGAVAPKVIDPNNPEHDPYKELWLELRGRIQQLS
jgi:hypothetical protein